MKVRQDALIIKTWGNRICGLATLVCVACTLQAAGPENRWKNPVDGSWHVDSNWSLEHVPTSGEQAFFPDAEDGSTYTVTVTDEAECELLYLDYHTSGSGIQTVVFTGGGTLGCRATSGTNYIRTKRKLVIDGISVTMGAQMLNYGGLIIKNSASCYLSGKRLYLWANGAYVAVGNSTLSSSGIYVNASETSITLDGGMVAGGVFWNDGKYDNANVAISISGGGSMSGTLELGRNSTLTLDDGALTGAVRFGTNSIFTINGGTWTTDKDVSPDRGYVNDTVTLNLNGGTVVSTGNWLLDDRRWVAGAPDFTFMHTRSGSRRANLATFEDSTVSIQSTLSVTNGGFCTTNAATYIGSGAMVLRNFAIVSGDGPIVSVAKIAMGNADANFDGDVFDSWAGSKYCLAGPMEIGAWTDWVARRASPTPIDISGDLMINTTDYFDDTIGRTIILDRVNVGNASVFSVNSLRFIVP